MSGVVDVRIVGGSWTDDLLPVLAIVISILTLIWTLWTRRQDQARLKIESSISIPVGTPGPAVRLIGIEVTNIGRSGSTVLTSIYLQNGRHGGKLWTPNPRYGVGPSYPETLRPSETARLLLDPDGIAEACAEHRINPSRLRVVATTGHGTTSARLRKNCRWLVRDVAERRGLAVGAS